MSQEVISQKRIFFLLFLIAGFLFFQSVQAQTLVDAAGQSLPGPTPGEYTRIGDPPPTGPATLGSILLARDGGTITGQEGTLTLNVTASGTQEVKALSAVGTSPSGTPSQILMTAGKTVINMPFAIKIPPAGSPPPNIRGAFAVSGGKLILTNGSSTENTLVDMRHSGRTFAEREI